MRRLLLLSVCCLSLCACASIVTERNDWFIVPAPAVKFVGTTADPGIRSQWIPYGTFTGGTGGTEYTRVTSNLYGVVYSVWDGYFERLYALSDNDMSRSPETNRMYRVGSDGKRIYGCQDTLRIMDWLNVGTYGQRQNFELELAYNRESWHEMEHDGLSSNYGGRRLDQLLASSGASLDPPISTNWFSSIPFRVADLNLWSTVWPVYSALTNDVYFFPGATDETATNIYWRIFEDWMYGWEMSSPEAIWSLNDIWGGDVYGYDELDGSSVLLASLRFIPLPYNMEDVLSYDTGWKYEVPPVETGSYWTVSGPIGNFRLGAFYDYGTFQAWDNNEEPYPTNYYVEISYNPGGSYYSLFVYDIPADEQIFQSEASGDESADVLYFGDYHAQCTRLYANEDDYAHWRNGTTRLDWKRLGILCQLERQMETTYRKMGREDYLPYKSLSTYRSKHGSTTVHLSLPAPEHLDDTNYVSLAGTDWNLHDGTPYASTNELGWCYPTCRTPKPQFSYGASAHIRAQYGMEWVDFTNMVYESIATNNLTPRQYYNAVFNVQHEGFESINGVQVRTTFVPYYIEDDCIPSLPSLIEHCDGFPDIDLSVGLGMSKSLLASYTTCRPEQSTDIKGRFEAFPTTNTWNLGYVSKQTRPTLEVMISSTNVLSAGEGIAPLKWDKDDPSFARFFRMNPACRETGSRAGSDNNRVEMLRDLDVEVKNKCVELGGINVDAPDDAARLKDEEVEEMVSRVNRNGITLQFNVGGGSTDTNALLVITFMLDNEYHLADISLGWDEVDEGSYTPIPSDHTIWLGAYGWKTYEVPGSSEPIGDYKDVRVDGHQNQMIKTQWKFKNLRDPEL